MIDPRSVFNGMRFGAEANGGFRADWHVPLDLPYFRGHFPGLPIFPAVGIVDATLHALRTHTQSPSLQISGIPTAKFLSPVLPGLQVYLSFRPAADGAWDCEWKEQNGDKVLTVLRLTTGS